MLTVGPGLAPAQAQNSGSGSDPAIVADANHAAAHERRSSILYTFPVSESDTEAHDPGALMDPRAHDSNAVAIYVALRILNFEKLDTKNATFRFTGRLIAEWDPATLPQAQRPPYALEPPATGHTLLPRWDFWEPTIIMVNILSNVTMSKPVYFITSQRKIRVEIRFSAPSVATSLDFSHFPFDTQHLVLQLAPEHNNLFPVRLEPLVDETGLGLLVRLPEWNVRKATITSVMGNRVDITVEVTRFWSNYMANTFLPMFIIACISYVTMWVPRNNLPAACGLVGTCIASLFLLKLNVSAELARMESLTFLDAIALFHLVAAATAATSNIVVARLWMHLPVPADESPAAWPRFLFPIAYFAGVATISCYYYFLM